MADYNQALMDLGATLCTPRAPQCAICPVQAVCLAYARGVQLLRPVPRRRAALPRRQAAAGVVRKRGRVYLIQRPAEKLLGGLWAFPQGQRQGRESFAASLGRALRDDWGLEVGVESKIETLAQTFSHYQLTLHVFSCQWLAGRASGANGKWVRLSALNDYPMGKADRQIARRLQRGSKDQAAR
jgi:A/G-specific adenine glycosylase